MPVSVQMSTDLEVDINIVHFVDQLHIECRINKLKTFIPNTFHKEYNIKTWVGMEIDWKTFLKI